MKKVLKLMLLIILFYVPSVVLAASIDINCPSAVNVGDSFSCTITGYHTSLAGLKAKVSYSGVNYTNSSNLTGSNMFVVSSNEIDGAFDITSTSKQLASYTFKATAKGTAKIDVICEQLIDGTDFTSLTCGTANKVITINEKAPSQTIVPTNPQKSTDATLKNIEINVGKIVFDRFKYSYDLEVEYDTKNIEVKGILNDSKAKLSIEGNTSLNVGKNEIKINVTAEDGKTKKVYVLNIIRKEKNISNNNKIKKLTIKNYSIDFNSAKNEYYLTINNDKTLSISVELENENAKYEIVGNNNLKHKSVIKINVTAEDGSKNTYTINIIKEKESTMNLKLFLSLSMILNVILMSLLVVLIKKYRI